MRKNAPRKWLHAVLDLLPVILIPVFMIYSHRHDVTEKTEVDIEYKYVSNEISSFSDLVIGNIYQYNTNGVSIWNLCPNANDEIYFQLLSDLSIEEGNLDLDDWTPTFYKFTPSTYLRFSNQNDDYVTISVYNYEEQYYEGDYEINFLYEDNFLSNCIIKLLSFHYYDSSSMPLQFQYTDYNEIENVDVQDSKEDVMSVFLDDFNNTIDKYFNMGNVFNLGDVYAWFNTNIFNGNAPQVIYSVWNIALYEFVMDLLFLLYALFMFFIDFCTSLIERCYTSGKGGK